MNYIYECTREASNLNSAEDGARKDLPRRLREISTQSLENINCIFFLSFVANFPANIKRSQQTPESKVHNL